MKKHLFRKTLFEDHFVESGEIEKFLKELGKGKEEEEILTLMRDTNWKINQVLKELVDKIPVELIINNLIKQSVEIAYWNMPQSFDWETFIKDLVDFHIGKTDMEGMLDEC